jgi:hypothetical protein
MSAQSKTKQHAYGACTLALALAEALSGCTGPQSQSIAPVQTLSTAHVPASRTTAYASSAHRAPSWMRPDAKSSDLLYVTDPASGQIFVYSYPKAKLEGVLTNVLGPLAACVDKAGKIWIADGSSEQMLKFAHGGTNPITILPNSGQDPNSCSIDPTTGNLAVSNLTSGVKVYRSAKNKPTIYTDSVFKEYYFAGYDNQGNIFLDGLTPAGYFQLAELPKGQTTFVNFSIPGAIPGGIEWDGKYITYGDQVYNTLYEIDVNGSTAKVVSQTTLAGAYDPLYAYTYSNFSDSSSEASLVVGCDFMGSSGTVAVWNYPAGGDPIKIYTGSVYPSGIAISPREKS